MDSEYIFGSKTIQAKDGAPVTSFVDGQVTGSRRHNINLMLDEWTHLNELVTPDLNSFLEMKSDVRLTVDGFDPYSAEHINKATPFQDVWLTSNTGGHDGVDGFANNSVINTATMDRPIMIETTYLKPEQEMALLERKFNATGAKAWIKSTVEFMNLCRDAFKVGDLSKPVTTRNGLDFLNYLGNLGDLSYSFLDTILAKYPLDERLIVLKFFITSFGIEISLPDGSLPSDMSFNDDDDEDVKQTA
jgi:frataxin-like iron-binding protein CyaY